MGAVFLTPKKAQPIPFYQKVYNAEDDPLVLALIEASKRIQGTSGFLKKKKLYLYAVLDDISTVLSSLNCGISSYFRPKPPDPQMCFFDPDFWG